MFFSCVCCVFSDLFESLVVRSEESYRVCVCVCVCVRVSNCVCDLETLKMWPSRLHLGLTGTQRQARKLILGRSPAAKYRLLSFNRMQFRVVTGLMTDVTP